MQERLTLENIRHRIHFVRGRHVMLQHDVAQVYGIQLPRLLSLARPLPPEFRFTLDTWDIPAMCEEFPGRRQPFAFTEHGVLAVACILGTPEAFTLSLELMTAFAHARQPRVTAAAVTPPVRRSSKPRRESPSTARAAGGRGREKSRAATSA